MCFFARHDNHVGRWLTSFRATWDPKFEKYAVVGSMKRPRQVGKLFIYVRVVVYFFSSIFWTSRVIQRKFLLDTILLPVNIKCSPRNLP